MTKAELISKLADSGFSKFQAERAINELAQITTKQLTTTGEFTLPGVGKFTVTDRAARTGRNPKTGEEIEIAASKGVKFKAVKALKDAVA